MQIETAKRLRDALNAAHEIGIIVDLSQSQHLDSRRIHQLAIEPLLAIIGEALNRANQTHGSLDEMIPNLRLIIGMRNRIVHGYDEIQDEIIWDSARSHIPELIGHLQKVLDTVPEPDVCPACSGSNCGVRPMPRISAPTLYSQ
jgi:uncharacterized protein with HEPN domain